MRLLRRFWMWLTHRGYRPERRYMRSGRVVSPE